MRVLTVYRHECGQVMVPYAPGTCPALLKWKPAHMNTVDFKLEVCQISPGCESENPRLKDALGLRGWDHLGPAVLQKRLCLAMERTCTLDS